MNAKAKEILKNMEDEEYELEIDGGQLGEIETEFDNMFDLKNEVEKELRYFQESDEEKLEITVKK